MVLIKVNEKRRNCWFIAQTHNILRAFFVTHQRGGYFYFKTGVLYSRAFYIMFLLIKLLHTHQKHSSNTLKNIGQGTVGFMYLTSPCHG